MTKRSSQQKFFTASEAAKACGVCRNTLLYYEAQGIISPVRVGVQRAFTPVDIAAVRAHRAQQQAHRRT